MDVGIAILVRLLALLVAALATGGLMVNWIGLARGMARISSAAAYTEFHQATNRTFDPYMPIVVSSAIVGGVALAAVSPGVHSAPRLVSPPVSAEKRAATAGAGAPEAVGRSGDPRRPPGAERSVNVPAPMMAILMFVLRRDA